MLNRSKKVFRLKVFVAFALTFFFVLSSISGIILFMRPEGSLAAWTGWSALGLDKKQWEGVHAVSVFLFFMIALFHLVYNWRVLISYLRNRKKQPGGLSGYIASFREFIAALLLVGIIFWGAMKKWPPLGWIADLRATFKSGQPVARVQPPVADAEKLTLAELSRLFGVKEERFLAAAGESKLRIKHLGQSLAEAARQNGLTPEEIFIRFRLMLALPPP